MWLIYARNRCQISPASIDSVKWRQADNNATSKPTWLGDEQIVSTGTIVDILRVGGQVGTLFYVDGHSVLGTEVKIDCDIHGREVIGVASWDDESTRSLFSLPEFG